MGDRVYPENGSGKDFPRGVQKGAYYNMKQEQKGVPAFQAPPPKAARLPQYYNDGGYDGRPRRRGCSCRRCCLWSCCTLFFIIVALGIFALVFWLVVRPKTPHYDVEDVKLSGLSITPNGDLSSGLGFQLDATTSYTVQARNPNKHIGIYYDTININVESEGVTIGKGSVAGFYQGHQNTTTISGQLKPDNLPLSSAVATALQTAQKNGNIPLYVTVDVRVRVKVGSLKTPHFWVHVRCNVNVNPLKTSGSQILSKSCKVKG